MRAISRSLRKGYEIIKNKSIEDMAYSIKNLAKSGMTDLVENVGLGLERFSKAWWHSKISTTTKYNPIFERDAEAIYLLFYAKNPFEIIEISANIIAEYIYENLDDKQKNNLNKLFSTSGNISNKKYGQVLVNEYAYYKIFNEVPSMVENYLVKKIIISALVYLIARKAFLNFNTFRKKEKLKVKPSLSKSYVELFLILSSSYGVIEKLDRASKRQRITNPSLYNRLEKEKLSLTYLFFENEISSILSILGNKDLHNSYEILKAFESLKNI